MCMNVTPKDFLQLLFGKCTEGCITGEQPITVQNSMDGENTRVMELYASPIGDTDFARTVHQTAAENYGFAGQMFMD